jgi:hypothetical protein
MLFNLSHRPFEELLPAWLDVIERLGPAPGMILGLRYISRSYVENALITAIAAAEALHRRLLPEERYTSEEEYEVIREAALQAVPEQHRDWLDQRMWNEPSLKQRLIQLVNHIGVDLVEPFMPAPNRWARTATNARNSLVHRFPDPPPPTAEGMYALAQMTTAVVTLNLLHEIGIPRSRLEVIVRNYDPFRWITEYGPQFVPQLFPSR